MSDIDTPLPEYLVKASQLCVERCQALKLKGRRADNECLSYMLGVAVGMRLAGNPKMAHHVETVSAWIIAVRGYMEVAIMAKRPIQQDT